MVGCATIDDLSLETYRRVNLRSHVLKQETIGVLPTLGPFSVRGYLPMADSALVRSLKKTQPNRSWLVPDVTLTRINESGSEKIYRDWAREYTTKNPPQQTPLEKIGRAIGTRYLLLTELESIALEDGATHVRLASRLWDWEEGEILWEGIGESRGYVFLIFPWIPSSFEKTLAVASDGLVKRLP